VPRKVFVAGEILTAADVNTNLMDQAVMSFAGTAARGSAIPSPVEGMVTYLNDADRLEVYTNAWKPVGSVLQVLSTTKTDTFSTTSTSHTDVTGLSVSITPSATSSKILVIASVNLAVTGNDRFFSLQLVRDSTAIAIGDAAGSRPRAFASSWTADGAFASNRGMLGYTPLTLDSPATTSSVSYKVQVRTNNSDNSVVVNRSGIDSDDARYARGASTITVMEVAG
jgi:hypothetical protein